MSHGRIRRFGRLIVPAFTLVSGCACGTIQSTLHPGGPAAAEIAWLWWVMLGAFTAVFALVFILFGVAIYRRPVRPATSAAGEARDDDRGGVRDAVRDEGAAPPLGRTRFIVAGGIILPIVVLTPLFLLSLRTSATLRQPQDGMTIRVVGHMWWWEVRYPEQGVVTANEIHIPIGKPVRLELASADVIHSFWVPRLHGKRDMIPGIENVFWIQADEPGTYCGQCGEYCGTQHANMAFHVVALPQAEFDQWLAERTQPRVEPQTAEQQRGFGIFMKAGCAECHAVRGTAAKGNVGPDLTHLGSRGTIGAAMLTNTPGNLAGWIVNPQAIKPGVKMPRTYLAADELPALVSYLEGLQ